MAPVDLRCSRGSGRAAAPGRLDHAVAWVEADREERFARGIARDGEEVREQWLRWMRDEDGCTPQEQVRARADLVVRT